MSALFVAPLTHEYADGHCSDEFVLNGVSVPHYVKGRIIVDDAFTGKECDVVDAVTGRRVATTARPVLSDSSGALVWRGSNESMFASSGPGAEGREPVFEGIKTFNERPFREFRFGALVVDVGRAQCRVLRFDDDALFACLTASSSLGPAPVISLVRYGRMVATVERKDEDAGQH